MTKLLSTLAAHWKFVLVAGGALFVLLLGGIVADFCGDILTSMEYRAHPR